LINKVLLVDDDPNLLAGLKRHLRKQFSIEIALSAEEAIEKIQKQGPYAVIVSDYPMPGMNGIEFLSKVKKIHPEIVRIMLTGVADMPIAIKAVNEGNIFQFHPKPCPANKLGKAIQSGIEKYRKTTTENMQILGAKSSLAEAAHTDTVVSKFSFLNHDLTSVDLAVQQ
jgi:DNA-binding NtrC family response regulator